VDAPVLFPVWISYRVDYLGQSMLSVHPHRLPEASAHCQEPEAVSMACVATLDLEALNDVSRPCLVPDRARN